MLRLASYTNKCNGFFIHGFHPLSIFKQIPLRYSTLATIEPKPINSPSSLTTFLIHFLGFSEQKALLTSTKLGGRYKMKHNTPVHVLRSCLMTTTKVPCHSWTPMPTQYRKCFSSPATSLCTMQEKSPCHNSTPMRSQYRNCLPIPSISLYLTQGKELLDESRMLGMAEGFFEIATNLSTQKELTYCGLSSLTTILNALFVDPQRVWKGSWRWYDESMLANAEKFKKIDVEGLSFQGLVDLIPRDKVKLHAAFGTDSSLQEFREHVRTSCSSNSSYILANYFRPLLGQTGKGHFSPIAAYNPTVDAVLIMDVACFKYPPHWVPCVNLWNAMFAINPFTGKSRGYVVISKQ